MDKKIKVQILIEELKVLVDHYTRIRESHGKVWDNVRLFELRKLYNREISRGNKKVNLFEEEAVSL